MDDIVKLDVGGCLYTTSRSTLTRYPDSMLAAMFSGELDPSVRDANGAYVMDRDGPIFRHVLNFFRQGKLILPEDFKEWDLLTSEADFYQVGDLTDAVMAEKMRRVTPEDSSKSPKFEFVEIYMQDRMMGMMYIGSIETLANLPVILAFLNTDAHYTGDALDVVKQQGMIHCLNTYYSKPVGDTRMFVFREIVEHGFELKAALCDSDGNKEWIFARKV